MRAFGVFERPIDASVGLMLRSGMKVLVSWLNLSPNIINMGAYFYRFSSHEHTPSQQQEETESKLVIEIFRSSKVAN